MEISNTQSESLVILWTDDEDNDRLMIEIALAQLRRPVVVKFVEDGDQAWRYLTGKGKYSDRAEYPFPHALVTDLKMPLCDGFELVERIRAEEEFSELPVLVFSSSDLPCDQRMARSLGADAYITKPNGFGCWVETILKIVEQASVRGVTLVPAGH